MHAMFPAVLFVACVAALPTPSSPTPLSKRLSNCYPYTAHRIGTHIAVYDHSTGANYGYVAQQLSQGYGVTTSAAQALQGIYMCGGGPSNIYAQNNNATHPFIGAAVPLIANSGSSYLTSGSPNYVILTATEKTSAGATPANGGNTLSDVFGTTDPIESDIWYDSVLIVGNPAQDISAYVQWINPDGSVVNPSFWYSPSANLLGMTGDYQAFAAANEVALAQVNLYFA